MIIYLTGQPGAGKTTLAKAIEASRIICNVMQVIDGDDLRDLTLNKDYSPAGRRRNLEIAHSIALFLEKMGKIPVIAMVSPFRDLREQLKARSQVVEFHVETSQTRERDHLRVADYEPPLTDFYYVCTDHSPEHCLAIINKAISYAYQNKVEQTSNGRP